MFESYYDGSSEYNKYLSSVQSRADVDAVGRWNVFENIRTYQEKV